MIDNIVSISMVVASLLVGFGILWWALQKPKEEEKK
jgi:hypothetical protein